VLLIVLYHAGIPYVRGGFVGVDVFFVLSGYLITSQLVASRDVRLPTLLREFYARRARRILPALALVTICTLIIGRVVLLPTGEQQD
jgi:peptidoglycan/LPS O-acetylase OafA/YrhL